MGTGMGLSASTRSRDVSSSRSLWRLLLLLAAGSLLVMLSVQAYAMPAAAQTERAFFAVTMTGADEAPGPGDPDGSGVALVSVEPGAGRICYLLLAFQIETATAAHIHVGPPGEPGPVVVSLAPPATGVSGGCVTDLDPALLEAIATTPGNYYVNVHNATYPSGAIRGQLDAQPE